MPDSFTLSDYGVVVIMLVMLFQYVVKPVVAAALATRRNGSSHSIESRLAEVKSDLKDDLAGKQDIAVCRAIHDGTTAQFAAVQSELGAMGSRQEERHSAITEALAGIREVVAGLSQD